MALTVTHSTAADGTFSTAGETAWEADHTVTGSAMAIGDAVTSGTSTNTLFVDSSGNLAQSSKFTFPSPDVAGQGPSIVAGTATTDVAAFSLTRTNNDAAVATGVKWTFTDTTSAAGFLPFQILGGAAGTTNLIKVAKDGLITAGTYFEVAAAYGFYWTGSTTILAPSNGVLRITDNAGTDFNRLQFGGTTSSFPSIKRSTTKLQARLADDSAYATFDGKFAASGAAGANFGPGIATTFTVVDGLVTAIS